jgi:hypothetical protein
VEVAPSTARGRPTGPGIQGTARRLEGAESRRAARLLAGKHPLLHGVLVPLTHRLGRAKTGKTVHFQLTPLAPGQVHPNARLLEAFYQAQAAFYAGGDDTTVLRGLLADDEWAVQLADGELERDGQLRTWQTVGVFRIVDGKIAECWLVPFDQYLFDELWS